MRILLFGYRLFTMKYLNSGFSPLIQCRIHENVDIGFFMEISMNHLRFYYNV